MIQPELPNILDKKAKPLYHEGRSDINSVELLKIEDIAGMYYSCGKPTKTLIIYGIGAPIPPDNGTLPDAPIILNHGVDIYVPDYIGYGRSDGKFTPEGCIDTFTKLFDKFTNGCEAINSYSSSHKQMQYSRIIMVGRSFGGTYVPVLPRFDSRIKELAILSPVVDSKSQGSVAREETNETFLQSMAEDGYHHLYRGVLDQRWVDHLENKDDLSPMDNISYMQGVKLFIGHGMKDDVVHFSKSVEYHRLLCQAFPDQTANFNIKLYPEGNHGKSTTNQAIEDFLVWLGL